MRRRSAEHGPTKIAKLPRDMERRACDRRDFRIGPSPSLSPEYGGEEQEGCMLDSFSK